MAKSKKVQAAKPAKKPVAGKGRGGKRSKAESMTGAAENEVETRPVLELQPIEIDERDFKIHFNAIKSATDKKETAMSLLRTCKKRAKEAGEDILSAVEKAMRFERMDQDDVVKELQIAGYALLRTENPIQLTLHNTLLGDVNEQAYKRGFKDGEAGKTANDDYPAGSDLSKNYMRGWHHGTGKNLGKTPDEVDAALADSGDDTLWNAPAPHLTESEQATA